MHQDDAVPPPRRPSLALDRPARTRFGPRRPKNTPNTPASHADAAVQSTPPQRSLAATFVPPTPLPPPPPLSFESNPIPWKGLPYEAAQWTFSSSELQEIVSKAIRLSARDSFVRLLSIRALEVDIVRESERLEAARLEAQAKWRFEVARRTMLMHALNASAAFTTQGPATELADGTNPIASFVGQLASAIAACDSLLSTILHISDQQSQIAIIQHQHWSSALGIALRKLNKAHERQAEELKRTQARVQTLEDELEEAWREAEKMAIEFDDLEQEIAESEGSEIVEPEDILDPPSLKHDPDETGTLGDMTIRTDIAVVLGVTATAVASKATLVSSSANLVPPSPPPQPLDKSDTRSLRSVKSTRSRRSIRDGAATHLARLTSARTRSRAASNASLRLPKALRSSQSAHPAADDAPPIPALPPTAVSGDSFLDMDNVALEHARKSLPKQHPEPKISLPTPPHSAGLPPTQMPPIWFESDGDKSIHLNALDRSQSLQIFSSLAPRKMRRSNLVMSLTGSDRSISPASPRSGSESSVENPTEMGVVEPISANCNGNDKDNDNTNGNSNGNSNESGTGTGSPTLNHSPVSLPTIALAHLCEPSSCSGSLRDVDAGTTRPGSAGARLTTTTAEDKAQAPSLGSPRKSLVSRASSVILRRLSHAAIGGVRVGAGGGRVTVMASGGGGGKAMTAGGKGMLGSPSRLNGGSRALVERWKDRSREGTNGNRGGAEGEVMLIGSLHTDAVDAP